jgi:hypothetical protein
VVLDIHSYAFFIFSTLLGAQFLMFGLLTRRLAGLYRIKPRHDSTMYRMLERFATLEYSLLFAFLGLVAGVAGALYCFVTWQSTGYAPMAYGSLLKPFLLSLAAMVISVQMLATFFFAASLEAYGNHRIE